MSDITISKDYFEQLLAVVKVAESLRETQKAYMANRGNEELGKAVGKAAEYMDAVLAQLKEDV